eukprot:6478201-Amphidinium_carterae.1
MLRNKFRLDRHLPIDATLRETKPEKMQIKANRKRKRGLQRRWKSLKFASWPHFWVLVATSEKMRKLNC